MSAPVVSFNPLKTSIAEAESAVKEIFKEASDTVVDAFTYSADPCDDARKLQACMNELAEAQKEMSALASAIDQMKAKFESVVLDSEGALATFDQIFQNNLQESDIDQSQRACLSSVQTFIEKQSPEEDEDSELLVTRETQVFKDPLTQLPIRNPIKSKHCGHVFEKSSIMSYLQFMSKKCPYSGCVSMLRKEDLIYDLHLQVLFSQRQQDE